MNLTLTANLTKKIVAPLLILVVVTLLIFLIVIRYQKTPKESEPKFPIQKSAFDQSPLIEKPQSAQVAESLLNSQEKPAPVMAYQIQESTITLSKASDVAASFGFSGQPETGQDAILGDVFTWNTPEATLSINKFKLTYNRPSPPNENLQQETIFATTKDLENYINQLLEQHQLQNDSFSTTLDHVNFLKKRSSSQTEEVSSLTQADIINILLAFKLDGYPLVDHNADQTPASLSLTKSGGVTSLSYRFLPEISPLEKYPLKTVAQVANEILVSSGIVAEFIPETRLVQEEGETIKILSSSLSSADLAYYLPLPPPQTLQPVYVFKGDASSVEGQAGQIKMLISAILEKFLIQP